MLSMSAAERREIMELRRAGKFYDHPLGPIGMLDIGSGRFAVLGMQQLNEFRFARLDELAAMLTPPDPAWDDSLCEVDVDADSTTVRAPEFIYTKWVTAVGQIVSRDDVVVSAELRFAEEPIDDATDEEIQAMLDSVHAKLGLE